MIVSIQYKESPGTIIAMATEVLAINVQRHLRIDHTILLEKLRHCGIRDTELQLIKHYFLNRYQLTEVNGYKSKHLKIKTGVPQGSVVGPLIFLMYINDLPKCSIFKMVMYVDDTTLYCNIDSGHTSSTIINDEIKEISRWLAANKLSQNVRKLNIWYLMRPENLLIAQF